MSRSIVTVAALAALLSAGAALAQGGAGPGPGPAASAPRMGMGPGGGMGGMGGGMGGMGRMRMGADNTAGWSMMSPQERTAHRDKMHSMKTHEECVAYQQQHHEQMAARAKERGVNAPAQPRRDPCAALKKP